MHARNTLSLDNLLLNTDSYKASHWLQYPPGVTNVFSYIESRGGVHPFVQFFGLQAFLKELASERVTEGDVDEAKEFFARHCVPFNFAGWIVGTILAFILSEFTCACRGPSQIIINFLSAPLCI